MSVSTETGKQKLPYYRRVHISRNDHDLLTVMAKQTERSLKAELSIALRERATRLGLLAHEEIPNVSIKRDGTG